MPKPEKLKFIEEVLSGAGFSSDLVANTAAWASRNKGAVSGSAQFAWWAAIFVAATVIFSEVVATPLRELLPMRWLLIFPLGVYLVWGLRFLLKARLAPDVARQRAEDRVFEYLTRSALDMRHDPDGTQARILANYAASLRAVPENGQLEALIDLLDAKPKEATHAVWYQVGLVVGILAALALAIWQFAPAP